jgi:hypothetical protein
MKIGDKFSIRAIAHKERLKVPGDNAPLKPDYYTTRSVWGVPGKVWSLWTRKELSSPEIGHYIGKRTIKDGVVEWVDSEVGNVFLPKRQHKVLLFVFSEYRNPVYVFEGDATKI